MNFKHLFLTTLFAASFGLVACDNSSSADSSDDNSNKKSTEKKQDAISNTESASCVVSTTSNSVTVVETMPGRGSYTSTVTDNGTRYMSIVSEYIYVDSDDYSSECSRMQKEASYWKDGSMSVTCTGGKIIVNEIDEGSLRNHEANFRENCDEFNREMNKNSNSSGSNSTNSGNAEFQCDVSRSSNSVKISQSYKGNTFEEVTTWSKNSNGRDVAVAVQNLTFTDADLAAEECEEAREEAVYSYEDLFTVECNGKNVVISKSVEYMDMSSYEEYYKSWCEDQERRWKNGALDLYI
jgi:hypothetical protein